MTIFRNDKEAVDVQIRAVFKTTNTGPHEHQVTHYVVKLRRDWFTRDVPADDQLSAKAKTRAEAFQIAEEYMTEFTAE